ncbi:MYND finger family protein [Ditylenchus destructor]|nr:MYND finger family protein [Ditylenchus destructor]
MISHFHDTPILFDDRTRRFLTELQAHWLNEYRHNREKALVEMTEILHQEFVTDQERMKLTLQNQFKEELEANKRDLEQKYRASLKAEMDAVAERFRCEISLTKKKQWCWQCERRLSNVALDDAPTSLPQEENSVVTEIEDPNL